MIGKRRPALSDRRADRVVDDDTASRLRAIINTAADGIITIDADGTIESANPAAERIFGYPTGTLVGRNVSVLMPEPHASKHEGYVTSYLKTGQAHVIGIGREVVGRRSDGSVFPMDLAVSAVQLQDRVLFTGIVRDIGERVRLEREILEISGHEQRRIGQDLHDGLCQQLTALSLGLRSLQNRLAGRSTREAENVRSLASLAGQAIAEARTLARGLNPVHLDAGGLRAALHDLSEHARRLAGIACTLDVRGAGRIDDAWVATHVYRIAQEAVNNAIRHASARLIEVDLTLTRAGRVTLLVRDDGRGFDPSTALRSGGMGLSTMRYRARIIGGTLAVRASAGSGTTVRLDLQLRRATDVKAIARDGESVALPARARARDDGRIRASRADHGATGDRAGARSVRSVGAATRGHRR